jgi:two-component system, cell cycle sensor histidine kinase and response regulator CckA
MNLVINARDAMPQGGKLTLELANVVLDEQHASTHMRVEPGDYVMLAVSDTGTGMDRETQTRIFEPFFTTKERGKGTGLGLSTVFGIVEQARGTIWVYSEVGRGSIFKVYLPRIDAAPLRTRAPHDPATLRGSETILLVEDEEQVRAVARGILLRLGYQVLEASTPEDAVQASVRHAGAIDLLLSDVVMPQMSGPELARALAPMRPSMKVLFMSGYTDDSVVHHGLLESGVAFLQKPITLETLGKKVRQSLESDAAVSDS